VALIGFGETLISEESISTALLSQLTTPLSDSTALLPLLASQLVDLPALMSQMSDLTIHFSNFCPENYF